MQSIRLQRLQKELFRLFNASVLGKLKDSRLDWVTITAVEVSPDLKYAKIYFSYLENGMTNKEMTALLTKASGVFKKEIAEAKIMRTIPEISFFYDATEEKARKLDEIFQKIEAEKVEE